MSALDHNDNYQPLQGGNTKTKHLPICTGEMMASSSDSTSGTAPFVDERVTVEIDGKGHRKWTANIDVDPTYHGYLIGTKAATKLSMEAETNCKIIFPPKDAGDISRIRIYSHGDEGGENVTCCIALIENAVNSKENQKFDNGKPDRETSNFVAKDSANKPPKETTHFVALPLLDPTLNQRYITFVDCVMNSQFSHPSCKVKRLFPSRLKLHLTIGKLQIKSSEEMMAAIEIMDLIKERHNGRTPVKATIEGLTTGDGNPAEAHFLFANLHGDGYGSQKLFVYQRTTIGIFDFSTGSFVRCESTGYLKNQASFVEFEQTTVWRDRHIFVLNGASELWRLDAIRLNWTRLLPLSAFPSVHVPCFTINDEGFLLIMTVWDFYDELSEARSYWIAVPPLETMAKRSMILYLPAHRYSMKIQLSH